MTDQQPEEFENDESEDVEAHRRSAAANEEPDANDDGDGDDEVEAHRRRSS